MNHLRLLSRGLPALLTLAIMPTMVNGASISGTASYRERIALPSDASFEATVEDVSRADVRAIVIGRTAFTPAGQVPIRFEVPYDASAVQTGHRYVVRARVLRGDTLMYTTTTAYPVLGEGGGAGPVTLALERVAKHTVSPAIPDRALVNTYWKLVELSATPASAGDRQREPHLILQAQDNRLAGSGGCNRLIGAYTLSGAQLSFGQVASTRMACAEGMEQEQRFLAALETVRSYSIAGNALTLDDAAGLVVAKFEAVDLT